MAFESGATSLSKYAISIAVAIAGAVIAVGCGLCARVELGRAARVGSGPASLVGEASS